MEKIFKYFLAALLAVSCSLNGTDPYEGNLNTLQISVSYPEGYADMAHDGVVAKVEDVNLGNCYEAPLDASGKGSLVLPHGLYRISVSDRVGKDIFNATVDGFSFRSSSDAVNLTLKHTRAGSVMIKEIYCGGCRKDPEEGNYAADMYVILHNNDFEVQYLDSLCFGSLYPYNSVASNPFISKDADGNTIFKDYAPVADAVWQFPGDGKTFPLQPGGDAVLAVRGAIDHSAAYPLSVNLNKADYFVMYNSKFFTNSNYNPVPGNNIQDSRILNCLVKTNPTVNATMMSINSPAVVLYKAKGMKMEDFINTTGAVVPIPGSTNGAKVLACPLDWVLDAVEVFNGSSTANSKRMPDALDAGYVFLSSSYLGHSLMRKVDEELSASSGFEVLSDTNNSSNDFYETTKQSLHE